MSTKVSFRVRIHDFEHPPPHCHVYCSDGTELVVTLPLLEEMFGRRVSKGIKKYLESKIEELVDEWETKNPLKAR